MGLAHGADLHQKPFNKKLNQVVPKGRDKTSKRDEGKNQQQRGEASKQEKTQETFRQVLGQRAMNGHFQGDQENFRLTRRGRTDVTEVYRGKGRLKRVQKMGKDTPPRDWGS